jgi:hypothetical protein
MLRFFTVSSKNIYLLHCTSFFLYQLRKQKILHHLPPLLFDENTVFFLPISLKKLAPSYIASFNRWELSSLQALQLLCSATSVLPPFPHCPTVIQYFFCPYYPFCHRYTISAMNNAIKQYVFSCYVIFGTNVVAQPYL